MNIFKSLSERYKKWISLREFKYTWSNRNKDESVSLLIDTLQFPHVKFQQELFIIDDYATGKGGFVDSLVKSGFGDTNQKFEHTVKNCKILYNKKHNLAVTLVKKEDFDIIKSCALIGEQVSEELSADVFNASYKVLSKQS